ncbi:MAG: UvrD-helicase domain-containing protein [Gemmatimonadota bacterium]|nr:UvrD-helicase domain-containing protein [Gemmatimonadota bacterium]
MLPILEGLNEQQQEAVCVVDRPVLVLAGAGSGKTRVLTHRLAYLIETCGVHPGAILAMTFTNKAAGEMNDRVEKLLNRSTRGMWLGTFHSLCARILRRESGSAGLDSNFAIYDAADQLALMRQVIRDQEISERQFPPRQVRARISAEKSRMVDPVSFANRAGSFYEQQVARIYRQYQSALQLNNAVDFDDLLMLTVQVFREDPEILTRYRSRFEHCLIDEYQDTNRPQYLFTRMLAEEHGRIFVVGDDDQSIYAWRGADLGNILNFERDFPDAGVIRLEQNYRSSQVILDAGNAVIRNNLGRKGKELWTTRDRGEPIQLFRCSDEVDEARRIARELKRLRTQYSYGQMAVLYRTNAQSRALEDGLRFRAIPYVIVGGVRFYERKEIKDVLAYLRLIVNPSDSVSLFRIVNTPRRGIGQTSLDTLVSFATGEGIAPYEALSRANAVDELTARARSAMVGFYSMIEGFRSRLEVEPAHLLAASVVEETGYMQTLEELTPAETVSRSENVQELLVAIEDFAQRSDTPSLSAFLREVALVTDVDQWREEADAVTLMTLHSAKGLEFPAVFIAGLEEGLFPILRDQDDPVAEDAAVEEERRLFYVGVTRAQDLLHLTCAEQRRRYGGATVNAESRFLREIPDGLIVRGGAVREDSPTSGSTSRPNEGDPVPMAARAAVRELSPASGTADNPNDDDPFPMDEGATVVHPTWGPGHVLDRTGSGPDTKLTVCFQNGSTKKVVVRFAGLKPG